jgi:hypothetical protein
MKLDFWVAACDFTLTIKLTGAAEVKAYRFGAKCFKGSCTFDHGGVDRSATVAAGKPRKLCTVTNTLLGCTKSHGCWFSHEAKGVVCAHDKLRVFCPKGP